VTSINSSHRYDWLCTGSVKTRGSRQPENLTMERIQAHWESGNRTGDHWKLWFLKSSWTRADTELGKCPGLGVDIPKINWPHNCTWTVAWSFFLLLSFLVEDTWSFCRPLSNTTKTQWISGSWSEEQLHQQGSWVVLNSEFPHGRKHLPNPLCQASSCVSHGILVQALQTLRKTTAPPAVLWYLFVLPDVKYLL
jgi:hypothetical protein